MLECRVLGFRFLGGWVKFIWRRNENGEDINDICLIS